MRITPLIIFAVLVGPIGMHRAPAQEPTSAATTQPVESAPDSSPVDDADNPLSLDAAAPSRRRGIIDIEEMTADLGFDMALQRRTVRTDRLGANRPRFSQTNKEYRFEETLGLETRGSIIDDNVLRYDAMIRGGLSQERYTETGSGLFFDKSESPDGEIFEYDLRMQAFPAGKVSATGYASKLDDRVPRPFLPSMQRNREKYGAGLFYNDPKLPMRLTFDHLYDELESGGSWYLDDKEEQGEDTLAYEATWQPTDDHYLNLEYEYERRSDRYSGTLERFDTTRNYFALTDTIQFGRDKRSRLDTYFRLEEETGDIARDILDFTPQLRLQHTDALFTTYKAQYLKEKYFELDTDTYRGDWGVTHQFKDLLTSTAGLYAFNQDSNENADFTEWGGLTNFSLSKPNRLGRFSSNLSYIHSNSRADQGKENGVVLDEAVTFRDPLPSYLVQRDVNRLSIIVRDPNGVRIYREGLDYRVFRNNGYTALQRIPTGLIIDRQTVLVSYTYRVFDNFEVTRDRIDLRVQQDFDMGLTPYYAMSWQDEKIDPQEFFYYNDRNINRQRIGFTYRQPRWSAGPEYEYNDDSIDPYHAVHANGDVIVLQNEKHQLSGRAAASYFRFTGEDYEEYIEERYTTLVDLGLTHRYIFGRNLEANSSALYRFQNDSLFGETHGVDLTTSIAYRIGLFTILVEAEYDMLDLPSSTDHSMALWLKVRREIPIIGKPRG
ncbi:MAG: hypothetical protein DCC65_16120 [Planctomycetota bacterium]|nr:MAG: hypothetical protein DCC65_16120 [Planctomycetota bacterium]